MNPELPASQQTPHPELNALAIEFKTWRAERPSRRMPVPEALRRKAVGLLAVCRRSHIITALGINSTMLKSWQHPHEEAPEQAAFVPLSFPAEPAAKQSEPAQLILSNRSGLQVTLHGDFSGAQLALVARALSSNAQELAL